MIHELSHRPIDLIWGAKAIADVLGVKPRVAYYLLETNQIPAKKVGERWVAERGKLADFFLGEAA